MKNKILQVILRFILQIILKFILQVIIHFRGRMPQTVCDKSCAPLCGSRALTVLTSFLSESGHKKAVCSMHMRQ